MQCIELVFQQLIMIENILQFSNHKRMMKNIIFTLKQLIHKKQHHDIVDFKQRGQYRSPINMAIGDTLHDFEVRQRKSYPDYDIDYVGLVSKKNQMKWYHFDCEQEINSFALLFDCRQANHLVKLGLEKIIQCGSTKYPIRDPFSEMTLRSFSPQNFTHSTENHILLGFQTPLLKDHGNLLSVTLQAAFNPLLRSQDFQESIWRYKYNSSNNTIEIEGDLARELDQLWYGSNRASIHNIISKNLLGKPGLFTKADLINLNHQDLLDWHSRICNFDNTTIITHGDMQISNLINCFSKETQKLSKRPNQQQNINRNSINATHRKSGQQEQFRTRTITFKQLQKQLPIMFSYKLGQLSEQERIELQILSYLLFDMPDSVMMEWNSPETPYPQLYGYQETHFNIGITVLYEEKKPKDPGQASQKHMHEHEYFEYQKYIRGKFENIAEKGFPDSLIERCLMHLEDQYYEKNGMKIISEGCLGSSDIKINEVLNVKSVINHILKNYRKLNIFQNLLNKYILNNQKYIRIRGQFHPDLFDDYLFEEGYRLRKLFQNMPEAQKSTIKQYRHPSILQDKRVLPLIQPSEFEIFEEKSPSVFNISSTPVYHSHKCDGIKLSLKIDISDIEEEQIRLLPVICEVYPKMGYKGLIGQSYEEYLNHFVKNMEMRFETVRESTGMKIYFYLQIQFADRNAEFGFNFFTNLVHDHDHKNISAISKQIQKKASEIYNQITENLVQIHGRHIASTKSPYAMIEDPIFKARSICNLAAELLKISNPKQFLLSIGHQLHQITKKIAERERLSLLISCKRESFDRYKKYVEIFLKQFTKSGCLLESIGDKGFPPSTVMKYFPNYSQEMIFEAFSAPYYDEIEKIPAALVLSTMINHQIQLYNPLGGCFLFKGALIAYLQGNRKKYLELESYYRKIDPNQIDISKRFIFKNFRRYTAADEFYSGVSAKNSRMFKQAVAMVDFSHVEQSLSNGILKVVKEGESSMLALGPHLGNYEAMIKRGWQIERSIEDLSVQMESARQKHLQIEMSKYINIY